MVSKSRRGSVGGGEVVVAVVPEFFITNFHLMGPFKFFAFPEGGPGPPGPPLWIGHWVGEHSIFPQI